MSYIYIASPYSHDDPIIRNKRYRAVMKYTAELLNKGIHCFSPILHSHDMALLEDMPMDSGFWRKWNFAMMQGANGLHVLQLDGWSTSRGVSDEITKAAELSIPITLFDPVRTEREHDEHEECFNKGN